MGARRWVTRKGAKVVAAARREVEGRETVGEIEGSGGEALFVGTDATKEGEVEDLVACTLEAYGRLDAAFNNAGGGRSSGDLADQTEADWPPLEWEHITLTGVYRWDLGEEHQASGRLWPPQKLSPTTA